MNRFGARREERRDERLSAIRGTSQEVAHRKLASHK